MTKTRIIIAGIGGVGGFFGGQLAKRYYEDKNIEIIFWARGENLEEIKKNGLKIFSGKDEIIVYPNIITNNTEEIGTVDLVIVCTKSFGLENIVNQLKPCINDETVILPLLNGVENKEKIKQIYPNNIVLDGCVFIVSRLKQAGVIENFGNIQKLSFGLDNFTNDKLLFFEKILKDACIDVNLSQNISSIIWEKYIFLSPIATATSYYDKNIGEIISNIDYFKTTKLLIEEVIQLAKAKNIKIPEDIFEITINKIKSLPQDSTTSMHNDFINKKPYNELENLTTYVISESEKYNIAAKMYSKIYFDLISKN
jgi:2-dehydropantoate 2-reductase